jgi:GT2 family glycosyltransferase
VTSPIALSVVIPTYQRADRARRLIDALDRQDLARDQWEVLVVDDASEAGVADGLDSLAAGSSLRLRVIHRDVNGGPAAARNNGARLAEGPVVAFIDDDCVPDSGWARAWVEAFERNPRLGVVQGLTERPEGALGPWTLYREITWETPWFEGCNIAYRRDALLAVGGFDEVIRWYGEDTSAGWKVVESGAERDFAPSARVVHDLEERGVGWRIRHGYLERNLVELALRHPGLRRDALWRPWAFRPESVTFPVAVIAVLAARRHPTAAALALPYLMSSRLPRRDPARLVGRVAIDAAQVAGHLVASVRHRSLVL